MAFLLGQDHNVVFFGPRSNPKAVRWWAERGQLHWEDSRDNGYASVGIREFLERLKGINDMISNGKRKDNENFMHADELQRHQRFIEDSVELVRIAKEQGDPDDVRVRKVKTAELKKIGMVVPSNLNINW
jgi:hypothetical protein|tara:strand:+ start:2722 stop:3111 length:390 start_codon:yes stop_codon:yes gene_type:complete